MGKAQGLEAVLKAAEIVKPIDKNVQFVFVGGGLEVENLKKMADQKGYKTTSEKLEEGKYRVCIIVENVVDNVEKKDGDGGKFCDCTPEKESNKVVVIRSSVMGEGDPELGKVLLKGFIYAISQQKDLPKTMLFYNGGAFITCEGSQSLEDLKALEEQGVKILTCGTCLNHYGLTDRLAVGEVTNMYEIAEKMTQASLIVSP
jgi:selenium metabolism protein YedF